MKIVRGLLMSIVSAVVLFGISGCSSMPVVTRESSDAMIDVSGNWNDTDSQLVSKEMISDSLSRPWLTEFVAAKNSKPRVIVGEVINKSHEHINTETFVSDLERELTNSGQVKFVASKSQRDEMRAERADQAQNSSMATAKAAGNETGADFMIKGKINTIMDEAGKISLKYYQIELELIDMANGEKAWIGQKKIKKVVKKSSSSF
jgi:hypothetical protein